MTLHDQAGKAGASQESWGLPTQFEKKTILRRTK